jgi:glutathione S-transferase
MIGTTLTAADLAAYFEIQTMELLDYKFTQFDKLAKWMKVMENIK